jgi:hypothetical protein
MDASHISPNSAVQPQVKFPLWQYLTQPVFHPSVTLVISPRRFMLLHQVEHLYRCWQRDCARKENL